MALTINNPLVARILQRAFRLQGRVRPVLEESIVPTVSLGDLSAGMAPDVSRHVVTRIVIPPVIGELATIRIEAIAGTVLVITNINFWTNVLGFVTAKFPGSSATLNPQASTASKSFTDGRLLPGGPEPSLPSGVLTFGTQAGFLAGTHWQARIPDPLGLFYEPKGWVVGGVDSTDLLGFLEFQFDGANVLFVGSVEWDEYQIF